MACFRQELVNSSHESREERNTKVWLPRGCSFGSGRGKQNQRPGRQPPTDFFGVNVASLHTLTAGVFVTLRQSCTGIGDGSQDKQR